MLSEALHTEGCMFDAEPWRNVSLFASKSSPLICENSAGLYGSKGEQNMAHDARQVANFIIDYCSSTGRPISNLSLQKIVYFCHAWSLVVLGKPLVRQSFEAWQYGPVIQHLYHEFKCFDRQPITEKARGLNITTGKKEEVTYEFDNDTEEVLLRVVDFYTRVSASDLVRMTHAPGSPWDRVWNHSETTRPGMKLRDVDILQYHSRSQITAKDH